MSVEMWAVFKDPVIPGWPDAYPQTYSVSPITSATPDSPDEVPGTRHWIEAKATLHCEKLNKASYEEAAKKSRRDNLEYRATLRRKAQHYNFAPHMFIDDELPEGEGSHVCQKHDVTQLYQVCRSCHYQAQRRLAELPDIE